jgi:hypothetical protein
MGDYGMLETEQPREGGGVSLDLATRLDWRLPTGIGLTVLILGSGVMGTQWALSKERPGIPGWSSFTGTTVGDSVILPILAASLLAAFRYLPAAKRRAERLALWWGAAIGACGGLVLQLSWLLDDRPRLSWVLPRAHHFSPIGYYHAAFLCVVSGALFSLAFGTAHRMRHLPREAFEAVSRGLASSPLLFTILTCIWTFAVLTIQGGGSGISDVATVGSVIVPSILVVLLCIYALRARWTLALPTTTWALILTALLCLLIIQWPANLDDPIGLIVAIGLTIGISFRDSRWSSRVVESCIMGAATVCLVVLPLGDPKALFRNLILAFSVAPLIVVLTAIGPLASTSSRSKCSLKDAMIASVFTTSVPIAAWLFNGGAGDAAVGAFVVFVAAIIFGELLAPWYQSEMKKVGDSEAAHPGVTTDPGLSALARRLAVRGSSWGIASVAALLGIVISAGPSMGFAYGVGLPDLKLWPGLVALLIGLASATVSGIVKRSNLAPALVVVGSLGVFGLVISDLVTAQHRPWWFGWAVVAGALVTIWQMESVLGNAAMRPQWLVRRKWQKAVAISVALAMGSLTLVACTSGMTNSAGRPAESLASLLIFICCILTGWSLVAGAGWALDWQPKAIVDGHAIGSGSDQREPNWARYRMRGCLLMDFGLVQALTAIGIWLPALTAAHIGLTSNSGFFDTAVMAGTGMLFFSPTFIWTLRNSVRHVNEQSEKAERRSPTWFYGTLPYVSANEEREVALALLRDRDGPVEQEQWAAALAAHQLHLNLIALGIAVASIVGTLGIVRSFAPEAAGTGGSVIKVGSMRPRR